LGFTLACRVAALLVIEEAASVTTVGAGGSVFNASSEPLLVPPALLAEIRKW
jgi:hypothetical protein